MRRLLALAAFLILPGWAFAQGVRVDNPGGPAQKIVQGFVSPIPGATITVCTSSATGTPCTPLVPASPVTLCTDSTCSTAAPNPFTADAGGNYGFWAVPGTYKVSITAAGVTGSLLTVTLPCAAGVSCVSASGNNAFTGNNTHSGTETFTGPLSFTSHNAMPWAGSPSPGATPTIDQAIAACTTLSVTSQCMPSISPGYSGAESANLFTTSTGYKVYTGPAIISDYRNNAVAFAPMYGITYGGRTGGALNRMGIVNYCQSPTDSCAGSNSWNHFAGTWPSNGGGQFGGVNLLILHDSQTVGSSTAGLAATDSEVHMDATSADNPAFTAQAYTGGVQFSRAGAVQDVLTAATFQSRGCGDNGVSPTARFYYCYGFDGSNTTNAISPYRNYAFHFNAPSLIENGQTFSASSADTPVSVTATEVNQTATFTMGTNCAANPTFVAGALVGVTGMSVAGYNAQMIISKAGCSGSSWSAFLPGTSNLAAGSGGTAQTTTPTVTTSYGVAGSNVITYQPLLDASGWVWKNKAGATTLISLTSTLFGSTVNFNSLNPGASGPGLGSGGGQWAFLGLAGSSGSYLFNPLSAAGSRTINIPDPLQATTTLPLVIANGTLALNTASITTATCDAGKAATATGTLSTDAVDWSFNAAPTATNKYGAFLVVYAVPSANTVTFYTCNPSATTSTPTAMTVNWSVRRP